ncbi:MAG: hypothetical protein ACIAQ0_13110 [Phycisphaerales bacterium JB058]|jgi:hypothetical protein
MMGMEAEIAGVLAQLGAAGLIGLMWLSERRSAHERERQVSELHDRIRGDKAELGVLLAALEANTRAMVSLEAGQRRLTAALERAGVVNSGPDPEQNSHARA